MNTKKVSLSISLSLLWIYVAWEIATQSPVGVMTDFLFLNVPLIIYWGYKLIKVTINKTKKA